MDAVSSLLGKSKAPAIPEAKVPAAPAPTTKQDAGATVIIGTDKKDKRNSGAKSSAASKPQSDNVLGNLGRGGLSI